MSGYSLSGQQWTPCDTNISICCYPKLELEAWKAFLGSRGSRIYFNSDAASASSCHYDQFPADGLARVPILNSTHTCLSLTHKLELLDLRRKRPVPVRPAFNTWLPASRDPLLDRCAVLECPKTTYRSRAVRSEVVTCSQGGFVLEQLRVICIFYNDTDLVSLIPHISGSITQVADHIDPLREGRPKIAGTLR